MRMLLPPVPLGWDARQTDRQTEDRRFKCDTTINNATSRHCVTLATWLTALGSIHCLYRTTYSVMGSPLSFSGAAHANNTEFDPTSVARTVRGTDGAPGPVRQVITGPHSVSHCIRLYRIYSKPLQ